MSKLIILDRDGVINVDSDDFIKSPDEWHAIPGSLDAIRRLCEHGYTVTVASNQSGVARGLFTSSILDDIHNKMLAEVRQAGGVIDRIAVCPHGPNEGCECRKPKPGLLRQLAEYYGVELTGVMMIGDSLRDVETARCAGATPCLVRSGKPLSRRDVGTTPVFPDLAAAVDSVLHAKGVVA